MTNITLRNKIRSILLPLLFFTFINFVFGETNRKNNIVFSVFKERKLENTVNGFELYRKVD